MLEIRLTDEGKKALLQAVAVLAEPDVINSWTRSEMYPVGDCRPLGYLQKGWTVADDLLLLLGGHWDGKKTYTPTTAWSDVAAAIQQGFLSYHESPPVIEECLYQLVKAGFIDEISLPPANTFLSKCGAYFKALNSPIRRLIVLELLHSKFPLNHVEIQSAAEMSLPTIWHHMSMLRAAHILGHYKRGRVKYYYLLLATLAVYNRWMERVILNP